MRILQVVDGLPPARNGGVQQYTAWLAEALAGSHDVTVATSDGADADLEGAAVRAFPESVGWTDPTGVESGLERDVADVAVDRAVRSLLDDVDPDVVHVQHLRRGSATIPRQCAEAGIPVLLSVHDFWTLCHRERLHRPDGQHCDGPESVEKCAACYADALSRTYRRECEQRRDGEGHGTGSVSGGAGPGGEESRSAGGAAGSDGRAEHSADARESASGSAEARNSEAGSSEAKNSEAGSSEAGSSEAGNPEAGNSDVEQEEHAEDASEECDAEGSAPSAGDPVEEPPTAASVREAVERRTRRLEAARAAADLLVAPSTFVRDRFVAHGTAADRVVTCPPGVRRRRYTDSGFALDGPVAFGYAGRITAEKGVHVLLDAFATVETDAELHVFGAFDPSSDDYHARLRAAADDRVTFHGSYGSGAAPFRATDVLVVPSLSYEPHPLVVQEAFAAGVPVVAGDEGGTAELIEHGRDGLTYDSGDPLALARCLQALASDPAAIRRLRAGVRPPKTMARHAREVEALYETCVDAPTPGASDADLVR